MFSRLKNLFKRRAGEEAYAEPDPSSFPPREFHPGYTPGMPDGAAPLVEDEASPPPAPAPEEADSPQAAASDSIRILLKPVLLKLPDVLKSRVRQPPAGPFQISVPLHRILSQLPQGSVKISFGELRQASPAGVFSELSDQDQAPVELPLPEILGQLRPDQIARRASQRRVDVPDDVGGIFGSKGEPLTGLRMGSAPARAPAPAAPAPAPAPPPEPAAAPRPATISARPAAPAAPRPEVSPATGLQPVAPIKPLTPLPPPPIKPASPLPAPAALRPSAPAPAPATPAPPVPAPVAPVVPATPVPVTTPRPSQPAAEPLVVALSQLWSGWPEAIRQGLAELPNAMVSLPADELEQSLRRGKIVFPWRRIRDLIDPQPTLPLAEALDETLLELPLPVMAPLYMAHKRKPPTQQKRPALPEDIPDIFAGRGMAPAPVQAVAPANVPVAPVSAPVPRTAAPTAPSSIAMPAAVAPAAAAVAASARPAPAVAAPAPPQDIGEVFGQPGRRNWTPSEMVQKTSLLRGVAGALIAMQDGLLVADHLPPGLNGETIAAFLPQMFSRMLQYTKELKFGEANHLTIIVDNVPLKIFKVGGVFFTVLGRDGEPLPEPHLSIVAAQLGPQNK